MDVDLSYWYVFPYAVAVSIAANASGFSGAVLFQPFFNFGLHLPIGQSVATGVATETIGMSSGAYRYVRMGKVDAGAIRLLAPPVLIGVAVGLVVFALASRHVLRMLVGLVVGGIALYQLANAAHRRFGINPRADHDALRGRRWQSFLAGAFSACTGTGVAEMHQPLLEHRGGLATKRANATAIALEALADWSITAANLSLGNLRFDILLFSASGVLIGAQIGAVVSPYLPDRLLKVVFSVCVLAIGLVYITTSLKAMLS